MARKPTERRPAYSPEFIGPQEPHTITLVPFPGFYDSRLSGEIDHHDESECENMAGNDSGDNGDDRKVAEHLRLDACEYGELIMRHMDYGKLHRLLAHSWLDAFNNECSDELGFDLGLKFESMDSPAFYNFETDRVFAHVPVRIVAKLAAMASEDQSQFAKLLKDRHQSQSGFHSFYDHDLSSWLQRMEDAANLDPNEIDTILRQCIGETLENDSDLQIYYAWTECDGIFHEWDSAMNWTAFDADVAELRKEKQEARDAAIASGEIEAPPPPRDPNTPDLFDNH